VGLVGELAVKRNVCVGRLRLFFLKEPFEIYCDLCLELFQKKLCLGFICSEFARGSGICVFSLVIGFVSREVWGRVVFSVGSEEDIRVCVSFRVGEHDSSDLFQLFF